MTNLSGELAALGAAFLWALSAVVYARLGQKIPPLVLNLSKGVIAIAFIVLTVVVQGNYLPTDIDIVPLGFLLVSGVIGIGLGDTFYFEALNNLGARRTLLLEALAPPLAALIALMFLQEYLSLSAWAGILLTVSGVAWVVSERVPGSNSNTVNPIRGISFGLLSALGQASGAVLSRAALAHTTISPLWSTLLRLIGSVLVLLVWMPIQQSPSLWFKPLQSKQLWGIIAVTALFSTYLGILLQQTALKYTATGVAQALIATSPLFILPIAIGMGEVVSFRALLGVLVALAGIGLLFGWQ
jgi:drug/metabolite transporter (DMT)-like permease